MVLFTIGYEQATSRAVIEELVRVGVKLLVDVRAIAASRRPGFSKRQLAAALDDAGIAYLHLQKLGTPKEGRAAARAGRCEEMFRIYETHLRNPQAREAMDELSTLARERAPICLLCFERGPACCHRKRIAEIVSERSGLTPQHLFAAPFPI